MVEAKNLEIYNKFRDVPKEAQKTIQGGRLKGFTDINPMWRIKKLTEIFGACGVGWKYEIIGQQLHPCGNEIAAFVNINLYYRTGDTWSEAIPGLGGSMFAANEKSGIYVDDECFKKALTDAIGVACKALGGGADVYWEKDSTKYGYAPKTDVERSMPPVESQGVPKTQSATKSSFGVCSACGEKITDAEWNYSTKKFNTPLCRVHQKQPPTLMEQEAAQMKVEGMA